MKNDSLLQFELLIGAIHEPTFRYRVTFGSDDGKRYFYNIRMMLEPNRKFLL